MNFNQLLLFQKVAELRHFTRAAQALYISQPAVSKQVHLLEQTLKQPLFTQVGQKIYLTEAGKVLYEYANRIFGLTAEAEAVLSEMQSLERGRLALGASTTIGTYLLPALLGTYKTRYPGVDLVVEIGNTEEIQQKLLVHRLEVGLVEGQVTHQELSEQLWRQDQLVLIMLPDFRQETAEPPTIQAFLATHPPVILREQGSGTRSVLEHALAQRDLELPHPLLELGSTEAIKRAVAAGLGVSFVSEHAVELEVAAGSLKQLTFQDFLVQRSLSITRLQDKPVSRAAQAFLQLIETSTEQG